MHEKARITDVRQFSGYGGELRLCGYCSKFLLSSTTSADATISSVISVRQNAAITDQEPYSIATVSAGSLNWTCGDPMATCSNDVANGQPAVLSVSNLSNTKPQAKIYDSSDQLIADESEPEWVRSIEMKQKETSFVSVSG